MPPSPKKKKTTDSRDKTLCKLVKNGILREEPEAYRKLITSPGYLCSKCGRVAQDRENLCKAEAL